MVELKTAGFHDAKLVLRDEQLASGFREYMELRQEACACSLGVWAQELQDQC